MEDTLRATGREMTVRRVLCLNPCFNGKILSELKTPFICIFGKCLNPCFNGRYSQRKSIIEQLVKNGAS